jgi:exonuclease SbcC
MAPEANPWLEAYGTQPRPNVDNRFSDTVTVHPGARPMIKRVTIENFMAHKLTTLELARGVTVITGPNNAGKSAIVEALRSIAQNPPYKHAIRHGAKKAIIRLELDSGEIIEWSRTEKASIYKILKPEAGSEPGGYTEEIYAKFGRTPPRDVQDLLRLDLVETETGPVDIHVGNQRQPIFLIDQAGSQAASFFAASTEAVYLLKMQQALKSRTDRAKSKRKELLSECLQTERRLEAYEVLDSIGPVLNAAEEIYDRVRKNEKVLPAMETLSDLMANAQARHRFKEECGTVLNLLSRPPALIETFFLEGLAGEIEHLSQFLAANRILGKLLGELQQPPPALHGVRTIDELSVLIAATEEAFKATFKKGRVLERILNPPEPKEVRSLDGLISAIRSTAFRAESVGIAGGILSPLAVPPVLSDTLAMSRMGNDLSLAMRSLDLKVSRAAILSQVHSPPSPHDPRELEALLETLHHRANDHSAARLESNVLQLILSPPEIEDLHPLEQTATALEAGAYKAGLCEGKCGILAELAPCPSVRELQDLENLITSLASTQSRLDCVEASLNSLAGTRPVPVPAPVHEVGSTAEQLCGMEKALEEMEQLQRLRYDDLIAKRREIEATLETAGICPLCGNRMDLAHFLDGMHEVG